VPLKSKEGDFVGKAALIDRKENGRQCLMGLELLGNEVPEHGDRIYQGRTDVGVITSATRSAMLNKAIALCRIEKSCADPGTEVEIGKLDGHQKRLKAQVVSSPFYDPERRRMRA